MNNNHDCCPNHCKDEYVRCPFCLEKITTSYRQLKENDQLFCAECDCQIIIDIEEEEAKSKALSERLMALGLAVRIETDQ